MPFRVGVTFRGWCMNDRFAQEPVPPTGQPFVPQDLRCDSRLPDESCCAGRCELQDAHDGPCVCACGTKWGGLSEVDDTFGGFRD